MGLFKYKDDAERFYDSVCSSHSNRGFTYDNELRKILHYELIADLKIKQNILFDNRNMIFFYFDGDNMNTIIGYDKNRKWVKIFRNFSTKIIRLIADFYETVEESK